jgi:hypothetical protein
MKRTLIAAALAAVLLVAGLVAVQSSKSETVMCTLTNTTVEKCCCDTRDGKLYCPLAKKNIEECCCVAGEKKATASR